MLQKDIYFIYWWLLIQSSDLLDWSLTDSSNFVNFVIHHFCDYMNCFANEYKKDHIFGLRRKIWIYDWPSQLSSCEINAWKNSGLNGIWTHDLCHTGAVLHQLIYQAIWELVTLWVCNIPREGEGCKWLYNRSYIWTAEKDMQLYSQLKQMWN